jgi:DNA-binding NtrC family response regulator
MAPKKQQNVFETEALEGRPTPAAVAEEILEKKLDDITTILCKSESDKSRIYGEIMDMVERSLVRIALRRSNHIKSAAAAYLGINRNTFQKKMTSLGIDQHPQ